MRSAKVGFKYRPLIPAQTKQACGTSGHAWDTARMARTNLEVVQEVIRLFGQAVHGEPSPELFELFARDVEIDMTRRVFNPDTYEGHAGLRRLGREVSETWGDFRVEPERFVESGDRVIVIERRRGRGRQSGLEVDTRSAAVYTIRHGKVVRLETDMRPEDALHGSAAARIR
jgi:ketosteroid isomerase-like protein